MSESGRRRKALKKIMEYVGDVQVPFKWSDAFENLVGTVLSQNTNDENSRKAFLRLKTMTGLQPATLANATVDAIKECIQPAGLYNVKAPRIKIIAERVQERFPDGLERLLNRPDAQVRAFLGDLSGVGDKTIDVLLAFSGGRDVLPVDTHVNRIARRLHFVRRKAAYGDLRQALEKAVPEGLRVKAHLALLRFGRRVCTARMPKCRDCPVQDLCPSRRSY